MMTGTAFLKDMADTSPAMLEQVEPSTRRKEQLVDPSLFRPRSRHRRAVSVSGLFNS